MMDSGECRMGFWLRMLTIPGDISKNMANSQNLKRWTERCDVFKVLQEDLVLLSPFADAELTSQLPNRNRGTLNE